MDRLRELREEFLGLWSRLAPFWGIPPAAARAYAFLLTRGDAVDSETIVEEASLSRGAVSMACRELVIWGLVHEERVAGSRRLLYRAESDPTTAVRAIVETRKRREWNPILSHVERWQAELAQARSPDAALLRDRLAEIGALVTAVDSVSESFLAGGLLPRLGLKALLSRARKKQELT